VVRQHWKPIALLMALPPVLAEVISGATPLTQIFLPWVLFPYVLALYGIQVLVLREIATRLGLGLLGLFCLGLVYGLYNEGLRAQTLFHPLDAPLEVFSTYGLVANVRVPFTIWISFWHGLFSVVVPVLLVEYLFPGKAGKPWLPLKATWSLAILSVATGAVYFLFAGDEHNIQDTTTLIVHFGFLVVAATVLWLVAVRLPRTPRLTFGDPGSGLSRKALLSGAGLYVFMSVVPEVLAQNKIPAPLFIAYFAVLAAVAGWAIARRRETTRTQVVVFLLGSVTAQSVLSIVFGILTGDILWALSGVIFTAIFVVALVRLKRKASAVGTRDATPYAGDHG
jgi:hypothetical protein